MNNSESKALEQKPDFRDSLIEKHIKLFSENNLHSLSLRHFIETGKASGSFRGALHSMMHEYAQSKNQRLTEEAIDFATWYSGMERSKVITAYKRYLKERSLTP